MVVPFLQCQSPRKAIGLRFHSVAGDPDRTAHASPDETGGVEHRDDESIHMQRGFHKNVTVQKHIDSKNHHKTQKQRKANVQSFVLCMRPPVPRDGEGKTAIDKYGKQKSDETSQDEEKRR